MVRSPILLALALALPSLSPSAHAQCTETELKSPEPTLVGEFGFSVASSDARSLVGAPGSVVSGFGTGAVFVFERGPSGYVAVDRLEPSDLPIGGEFGGSVDLDGERAVVGAERVGLPNDHGAAYVFELGPTGWVERARLVPPAGVEFFGHGVAIEGDTVAVAASDSAFVYERDASGTWTFVQRIDGPPLALLFGSAIALAGDTLVVGAQEDISTGEFSGAAYVYERGAGGWSLAQTLAPAPGISGGGFGTSLALSGERLAIGEPAPSTGPDGTGSVHVYERQAGVWVETDVLSTGETSESGFGFALDLAGDRLLVGHPSGSGIGPLAGTAFLFERSGGSWSLAARLDALAPSYQQLFGFAVALDGAHATVGAPHDDDVLQQAGSIHVFERAAGVETFCDCPAGPCGNDDAFGGCATADGPGAILSAWGSASVAADDLYLQLTYGRAGQSGIVFMGSAAIAPLPLHNGLRCVGGSLFRFPVRAIDAAGCMQEGPGLAAFSAGFNGGAILPGSSWSFQGWFRDPGGACGSTSNLSNAVTVPFLP